jgi:hypothetical protein
MKTVEMQQGQSVTISRSKQRPIIIMTHVVFTQPFDAICIGVDKVPALIEAIASEAGLKVTVENE